jgi:hypothetical protein
MRNLTVTLAIASTLFACQALANASDGIANAPAPSALFKKTRERERTSPLRPGTQQHAAHSTQSADAAAPSTPPAQQPTHAQQDPGPVCCCRFFAQGWQHAWRGQAACDSAGGTCAAPDHCR